MALPDTKAVRAECESFSKQVQNQLMVRQKELSEKGQALQKEADKLGKKEVEEREMEIQRLQGDLERLHAESQEKVARKYQTLMMPINEKVQKAIEEIAKREHYTHVLNTVMGAGMPILCYVDPKFDISDVVLKELGVKSKEGKK